MATSRGIRAGLSPASPSESIRQDSLTRGTTFCTTGNFFGVEAVLLACATMAPNKILMARRKKAAKELQPNIKVRLDRRTVITVRDQSKLAYWKEKFPGLEILEES